MYKPSLKNTYKKAGKRVAGGEPTKLTFPCIFVQQRPNYDENQ